MFANNIILQTSHISPFFPKGNPLFITKFVGTVRAMPLKPVCILYGSQTGCAKGVAEHVHSECTRLGIPSTLSPANDYASAGFLSSDLSVIVCSTTGDGDAPMNAEEFLRFIRRRTHAKDMLSNLRVASLGLGDTNYDKFCNCSKQLVKRLGELGATPLLPAAFADEGVGLDSTIDPWLEALFPLIKTSYTASTAEPSVIAPSHLAHENKNDPETIMPLSPMAMMQAMKSLNGN